MEIFNNCSKLYSLNDTEITFKNKNNKLFTIIINIENNIVISSDNSNNNYHLVNILNKFIGDDIEESLIKINNFIENELDIVTYYCVGCQEKLNYQTDE